MFFSTGEGKKEGEREEEGGREGKKRTRVGMGGLVWTQKLGGLVNPPPQAGKSGVTWSGHSQRVTHQFGPERVE